MREQSLDILNHVVQRYPILKECLTPMRESAIKISKCFRAGGRLLICGNGGSCADSFHIVGELMKSFVLPRPLDVEIRSRITELWPESADYLLAHLQGALPALSLSSEAALASAFANDEAADLCFAQQVLGQGRPGDILLAIATSGNSKNILYAAQVAKARGLVVIALTGDDGGQLKYISDAAIVVPRKKTHEIQELHLPVYHAVCLALEEEFFGKGE